MSLNGTYKVTYNSETVGTLSVSSDGLRTVFTLDSNVTPEISRLICTDGIKTFSVGIPVPVGDKMRLNKTFTKSQLKAAGITEITEASLIPLSASVKPPYSTAEKSADDNTNEELCENLISPPETENSDNITECLPCESYPDGWKAENDPASLFTNDFISETCKSISGALSKEEDGCVLLAIPISESRLFPLTSFLCFGKPIEICGEKYICFTVKSGDLV